MFEKYTEKARRVIFFARYEASQFGSPRIETEHLLLGLIREDTSLTSRFLPGPDSSLQDLRKEIEGRTLVREKVSTSVDLPFSEESKRALRSAAEEAEKLAHRHIGTEHLLLGLLGEERSVAAEILRERGLRPGAVREELLRSGAERQAPPRPREPLTLTEFSRDLTAAAEGDRLDPLIGREAEIERVVQILCRRTKNNPVLIGEPGVGKTAIVEGLAARIASGRVPGELRGKRILALDLSLVVAGTKYRGQFEERMKIILKELAENRDFIVFVDEVHTLMGAGSAEGSLDAANILKPALSRGEIQCIGSTTPREYARSIEKDRSLERRFQSVRVAPPSEEETIGILRGIRGKYESFHGLAYTEEALAAAVYLSSRYISDRFLPDKAIDVIDEAGARVKLRAASPRTEAPPAEAPPAEAPPAEAPAGEELRILHESWQIRTVPPPEVTRGDIEQVVARWTGIPVSAIREEEGARLLGMEEELHRRIISQDRAIGALSRAIRRSRAGLKSPGRPVGSFLFLGPTGVGKTETARSLAAFLFGTESALVRLDMSEYMEKHSVSRLIGSPPGYVGHEEGGQLTERIKRNPYSVLLLDEIEKAHPDVSNILLQVFEDGRLTDSRGTTVDFKNTLIIMTSNIGARLLEKGGAVGFRPGDESSPGSTEDRIHAEVRRVFNPEFLNRIDEILFFDPLGDDDLEKIVDLLIGRTNEALSRQGLSIALRPEARSWIVRQTCRDRTYGARPLGRAIRKHIEDPLAEAIIRGRIRPGSALEIVLGDDALLYVPAGHPAAAGSKP